MAGRGAPLLITAGMGLVQEAELPSARRNLDSALEKEAVDKPVGVSPAKPLPKKQRKEEDESVEAGSGMEVRQEQ